MCAFIEDHKESYDQESTQNKYIDNMDNYKLIFDWVDCDHNSMNTVLQKKYKNGSFLHIISQIVSELSTSPLYQSNQFRSSSSTATSLMNTCPFPTTHPFSRACRHQSIPSS